jgi:hypothetical protein
METNPPGEMTPDLATNQDPKVTAEIRRLMDLVPGLRAREEAIIRADIKGAGSLAELDGRHSLGRHIFELSATAIGVAGDHLDTWRRLIEDAQVQPGWAHVTILRGAIETSCFCRWLVDPTVNSAERIRRGVAAQIADWHERDMWERAAGVGEGPRVGDWHSGGERVKDLESKRAAAGVVETRVPKLVDLCGQYGGKGPFGGVALYRFTSAFAHGKQWTLLVSDAAVPDGAAADEPGPRRVSALDSVSALVTLGAVRAFSAAVADFESYVSPPALKQAP